ncbi:unnamed protein product, partial [Choristocarpus tenellus]
LARQSLRRYFDEPQVESLEFVLQKRVTPDEASRYILFFPNEDQAAYYPLLIDQAPDGAPLDHPNKKLQIQHLTLLYILHVRSWSFLSSFVVAGGLPVLSTLLVHPHLVLRSQAVSILASVTSHESFDWFSTPKGTTEAALHHSMLVLRTVPTFLPGLLGNSWGPGCKGKTFPGGALICLEILAMWLSWVRALYTRDGKLRLSRKLLLAIDSWGG